MNQSSNKTNHDSTEKKSAFPEDFKRERPAIIAELCFIVLPFIVICIINLTKGEWIKLIQTSDWALMSTLLFGQTIVKIVMGVASQEHSFNYQNFGLISALIIVFGLIPSVMILSIFQIYSTLTTGLIVAQFFLLVLSIIAFLIFGTIGQILFTTAFRLKISKLMGLVK